MSYYSRRAAYRQIEHLTNGDRHPFIKPLEDILDSRGHHPSKGMPTRKAVIYQKLLKIAVEALAFANFRR
jgi:hypothetical protein